jgi:plasmid stabilization system protein ParE
MSSYSLSPQAVEDLLVIWQFIGQHSEEAANRVQSEFYRTFDVLAKTPGLGHQRTDLTKTVLFFPLYSYLIVYQPEPVRIVAVIHGRRDVKRILNQREP